MGGGGGVKKQQAEKEDQMKTIINRCGQNQGWALVRRGD